MITVVDPTPPSNPAGAILVFQQSSMTNTRLYAPGADPKTDAAYVVTASPDVRQVALRRGPQGDGPVLATVAYAGAFARARGRLGTVAFAGRDAKTPIEEWLATSKGTPKKDVRIALSVGGTDCVWTVHVQDGAHGICDLSRGDVVVASYVPSRSSAPEGFEVRDMEADAHHPIAADKTITRAYIEFLEAAPTDRNFQEEVVLSLLVFQHIARVSGGMNAKGYNASAGGCVLQ